MALRKGMPVEVYFEGYWHDGKYVSLNKGRSGEVVVDLGKDGNEFIVAVPRRHVDEIILKFQFDAGDDCMGFFMGSWRRGKYVRRGTTAGEHFVNFDDKEYPGERRVIGHELQYFI